MTLQNSYETYPDGSIVLPYDKIKSLQIKGIEMSPYQLAYIRGYEDADRFFSEKKKNQIRMRL